MANPNLLSTGVSSDAYGQGRKYIVSLADLKAIGAATSGNIILDNLPAGAVVLHGRIKATEAVAGPSISAATARVATANNNYGAAALDVFQAVGNTVMQTFGTTTVTPVSENYATTTPIYLAMALTGANASVLTAGNIEVFIRYTVLK